MKRISDSPFFSLILRDFYLRYIGSYIGIMWGFIQPCVTLIMIWVVFSMGFKVEPRGGVGFMEWVIPGYVAWQYFSEAVMGGTSSIRESSYLVKKMAFRVEKLPVVKILVALIVHMVVLIVVMVIEDGEPLLRRLQVVYYLIGVSCLAYGVNQITSALSVYTRDVEQVVAMMLQLGFWGTPIFWEEGILPEGYRWLVTLNPMSYIVEGYRQSIIGGLWFWERSGGMYYWVVTLTLMWIGRQVFKRLRPHFADVL